MAERALKSVPPAQDEAQEMRQETRQETRPDMRQSPPTMPASPTRTATPKAKRLNRRTTRLVLFGLLPIALIAAGYFYVTGGKIMSTDDAYVDAEKVGIATDIAGIVQEVDVKDNDHVATGQVLYRLDPRQFQIALDNAKANLAQTALSVDSMKQDYKHMVSDADAQQAQVDLDQTNFNRSQTLLRSGTTPQAMFDQAQYTLLNDKSKLASLRQQAATQLARLGGNADIETTQHPQYLKDQAQVEEAQRQLDHTVIKAPFSGTVTNVPSVAPGKYLAASTTAFYLVDTDHVWIAANPKETEVTHVRPGQKATITVDTYPDAVWHGTVESVSPAAAQEFSLLPAQNTSGNWVKVVQRVPMRVHVDADQSKNNPPLRAGMSAIVDVDTGHARGFPRFW
ncbi:MAG TPA: HlyD family secretion protein [Xanthobacteraceae bacterium]|jgi:membrane fusion protein (multidrug efflux system)|nr:HlyD family secretion protein [Xanthobacteraceae bacterium]